MSGKDETRKALDARLPARADYDVGYGKPPKATRFKPGQSGNPSGRPKGAKDHKPKLHEERLKEIILEEAYRSIKVREGDRNVSLPIAQAVVRSLAVNAAKGQHRAQRLFAELLIATEAANKRFHNEWVETAIGYKLDWERELERRAALGVTGPEPLPHPDDIEVNLRTGEVFIKGPMTKEEKAEFDWFRARKTEYETELAELRQELIDDPEHVHRNLIEDDIARTERMLEMFRRVIPDDE